MLARFAALTKRAEEETRIEEETKAQEKEKKRLIEEKDEGFSSWVNKAKQPDRSPQKRSKIETYDTVVKTVDKTDLVWAPVPMKGPNRMAMARVCEFGEAALEQYIDWPIPESHVLVEFICIPTSISRFAVIAPTSKHSAAERCVPYNCPPKKSGKQSSIMSAFSSGGSERKEGEDMEEKADQWDPDRVTEFYNAMKVRYNVTQARMVTDNCLKVGKQFLKLAQEKTIAEAQFERSRAETDEAIAQSRLNLSHSGESADMAKYALVNDSSAEGDTVLSAGDFIGYQCKIFKVTRRSQVIAIDPSATHPLTLANDDIIYSSDLIVKHSGGDASECEELHSRQLADFTLKAGEIDVESAQRQLARQTKRDLKSLAKETGMSLNTSRTARERARAGDRNSDIESPKPKRAKKSQ